MRAWHHRKASASTAATGRNFSVRNAPRATGKSSSAAKASRVIQEVNGLKSTCNARSLRPVSSHTAKSPAAIRASPAATGKGLGGWTNAAAMIRPAPAPPRMKFSAARASQ